MQFANDFLIIKKLEQKGHTVILPANSEEYAKGAIKSEDKWKN